MAVSKKTKKKPSAKKTRTEAEYQELRKMTIDLANCAVFVLRTKGKLGVGSGMVMNSDRTVKHWSTQFFDALDAIGIRYDRDLYMEGLKKR